MVFWIIKFATWFLVTETLWHHRMLLVLPQYGSRTSHKRNRESLVSVYGVVTVLFSQRPRKIRDLRGSSEQKCRLSGIFCSGIHKGMSRVWPQILKEKLDLILSVKLAEWFFQVLDFAHFISSKKGIPLCKGCITIILPELFLRAVFQKRHAGLL